MTEILNEIQTGITTGSLVGAVWVIREILPAIIRKMKNGDGNSKKNTFCPGHIELIKTVTANETNINNIHHKLDEVLYEIRGVQRSLNRGKSS